jgi:hypothetical protein
MTTATEKVEASAKNTLDLIKKFGGKVIMFDDGGEWEF